VIGQEFFTAHLSANKTNAGHLFGASTPKAPAKKCAVKDEKLIAKVLLLPIRQPT